MNLSSASFSESDRADRIGVIASVLCAIHCAITPVLLIVAPAFGGIWSHPLSHWIAAAFVVPLAVWMVIRGFRTHRKRWILAVGATGISLILVGAALPYMGKTSSSCGTEADTCCPSIVEEPSGEARLNIPPAAAITILGGFALIVTHTGNLCACKNCRVCGTGC